MDAMDDSELLREYATEKSETAFASLVQRHIHFVYSSALRQVRNAQLAEEVTQAVFIILARKAGRIRQGTVLAGWFFNTARFVAAAELRAAARRHKHEQEAGMESLLRETTTDASWEQIAPFLDEGLAQLSGKDRQAVLLRFFEEKSFLEVGAKLGANEDAARMRVARALKSLRGFFSKRGLTLSVAALTTVLSANVIQAAPASLVAAVSATAALQGAGATGSTAALIKGALSLMAWAKLKTTVTVGLGILLAGVIAAPLIMQQQALAAARAEQSELQARLLNPAQTVRPTGQIPGTIDMAVRDRADLESLRVESAALQAKITEFSAQAQQLAAASSWHKPGGIPLGQIIRARDARDVGQATPAATMQTAVWCLSQGDTNRLAHLMVMESGADVDEFQSFLEQMAEQAHVKQSSTNGAKAEDIEDLELHLLEQQPGQNNDQWIILQVMTKDGTAGSKRDLLRPTDTGWKWVVGTDGDPVDEDITDQP
jgi:RNA polymerase sigma factor (sigma-70 family)